MNQSASIEPNTEPTDAGSDQTEIDLRIATEKTDWLDRVTDQASEWLSPILIKELRQTLKSYQFVWTFFLLLAAVMLWTLIGWTVNQPVDDYSEVGPVLLLGYYWILGFPLGIVIPFAAYRSLAREFDDGTIQLISISTMRSWQIVIGKLVSSVVQMLIYLAILAPCISFTYLLRGLSVSQITSGLVVCIVGSCLLSSLGLFLAALARSRFFSVGISILLVIGLAILYCVWCGFSASMVINSSFSGNQLAWQMLMFGWIGFAVSTSLLLLSVTSSLISFESDNRSTLPKCMMLVQQTVFLAWCLCMISLDIDVDILIGLVFILSHFWMIMGFAMVGESPKLSERVQRSLPKSIGMRSLFSLFVPGPGRGLIYSVTNLWASGAILMMMVIFGEMFLPEADRGMQGVTSGQANLMSPNEIFRCWYGTCVAFFYVTLFISLMYLFMQFVSKKTRWNWSPIASVLLGLTIVALATTVSLVLHYNLVPSSRHRDFSLFQYGNWYWATWEASEPGGFSGAGLGLATAFLACVAMLLIATAIIMASKELLTKPGALPARVAVDDQQIEQSKKPPVGETIDDIFNEPRPDDTT